MHDDFCYQAITRLSGKVGLGILRQFSAGLSPQTVRITKTPLAFGEGKCYARNNLGPSTWFVQSGNPVSVHVLDAWGLVRILRTCASTVLLSWTIALNASIISDTDSLPLSARDWPKLMEQAQHGNRRAQTRIGIAFRTGTPVERNFAEAMKWLSQAAEQADPMAELNLAVMYYRGEGVKADFAAAAKWFDKAASHGLPEAQFDAACFYETGLGVQQNLGSSRRPKLPDTVVHGSWPVNQNV